MRLDGKVAHATGAALGMGEAFAKRLAREGSIVILALSLATISPPFTEMASAKSSKDNLKIGIISFVYSSPSITAITDAAMADCKARGWTCELFDGKGDPVATSNAGVNFINRKFDVILNSVSDNRQLTTVIKAANAANIPFVSMFSGDEPGITADVGASGVVEGAVVGGALRDRIDLKGKVALVNWNVNAILRERTHGFKAAVADDKDIQVIDIEVKVPGQVDDTYNQVTALLQSNKDIKAIVTGWDELAPGAIRAIEQAGMKDQITVYSFDGQQFAFDLIRKNSPMIMTVGFGKEGIGKKAMSIIADVVDGKQLPSRSVMVRSCIFTKVNLPPVGAEPDYTKCSPFTAEIQNP
jgi:ribose transport system substrate-binding protein